MSRVLGRALAVLPAELGGSAPGPLHALLSALASASSRQEEECLVRKELSVIQQQLNAANFNPDVASECLVRLIHCSTLGYSIGFCTIHALTLAQRGTSWHKRLGYLACCLLLHENHELLLLLVNTLMKDLQNGGPLEMGMALTVAGQLTPPHAVSSILPIVIDKLAHSREFVRQKAVAALMLLTFRSCNKSSDNEISDNCHPSDSYQRDVFLRAFGDRDPSVMAASLPAFLHLAKRDPDWCRPLIPALVGVLRQVIEGRLHGDFSFHGVPSPWLQISLLRLFYLLGKGDHGASHQIYEVLGECMERARSKQMAAWAVLSECIRTLSVLPPHLELWTRASDFVGEMLQSSNANLQYMGVRCLADMARVDPGTVLCHRPSVLCALEQPDPAIRRRTLELMCRVVGQENVEAVCGHLLSALRDTRDPYEARSLASRTLDLAYKFSPNSEWLVRIVTQILSMKEEIIPPDEPGRFLWLLVKEDEESAESLKFHALQAFMASSTAISSRTSQPLLQAITWVLGEISHVQPDISSADISSRLSRILVPPASRQASHPHASSGVPIEMQAWLLTGLSKILSRQANELKNASLITEELREEGRDEEGQDVEMTRETGGEGGSFAQKDTDHLLEKAEIFSKADDQIKDMNAAQKNQTSSSPEVVEEKVNGSQAVLDSEECNEIGTDERVDIMGTSDVDQNKVSLDKYETEAGKSEISTEDNGTRQSRLPLPALDLLSEDPCVQQLIDELRRLWASPSLFAAVLPASPGCRTPLVDPSLPFLDGFVAEALRKGAAPYVPPQLRQLDKQGSSYDVREVHVSGALSESVGQRTSPTSTAGNSWAQEAGSDVSADITQPATRVWGPEGRTHCPSPTRATATTALPTSPGGSESGSHPPSVLGAVSHGENREREKDEEIQAGRKKLAAALFAGVGNIQGRGSLSRTNRELSLASESIKDVSSHTALALSTEEFGKLWTSAIHETRFAVSPPDPHGSLNQFSTAPGKAWLPDFAMQALRAVGFCNVATVGEEFLFAAQDIKTGAPLLLHCIVPLTGDLRLCARAKAPHLVQHLALSVQRALSSPPWPAVNQKS